MPFNKLHTDIKETLARLEIETPTSFQSKAIPVIKSGANVFCVAPKDNGKTTTLVLTTLQKLNCKAEGHAPRGLILVENKDKALELYAAFLTYTKYNDLRVYVGYKELHIDVQKSEIFEGIDILITTPKSLHKLFLLNGVSTSSLKICSIDDGAFLSQKASYTAILAVTQSIRKCQYVLYSEKTHPMLGRFKEHFMERAKSITMK